MKNKTSLRVWVVRWMYGAALTHLLVGILLPWVGNLPILDGYHRHVEAAFWAAAAPAAARAQQVWWIALFGPTLQSLSLWMGALTYFGDRYRSCFAWASLMIGIVLWGPQDIWISLQADAWVHVWIDGMALLTLLPPLVWLYRHDRQTAQTTSRTEQTRSIA